MKARSIRHHLFGGILAMTAATSAVAGNVSGTVSSIIARPGLTYFFVHGTNIGRPSCASNHAYWMIPDESSDAGKQQLALLMTAKATGRMVTVEGTGQCTKWPDGEDVMHVILH